MLVLAAKWSTTLITMQPGGGERDAPNGTDCCIKASQADLRRVVVGWWWWWSVMEQRGRYGVMGKSG